MQQTDRSTIDSKDLLEGRVSAPIQSVATDVKSPCTGFCYMIAQDIQKVVNMYKSDPNKYHDYIGSLIRTAGVRKRDNPKIHVRGEYINQDTIKTDFPDVHNSLKFQEFATPDQESFDINQNNLYMLLFEIDPNGFLIVTRSDETFIMIKLDVERFLVVDSHQPWHGTVGVEKATHYILKNGVYRGLTQIGYRSC